MRVLIILRTCKNIDKQDSMVLQCLVDKGKLYLSHKHIMSNSIVTLLIMMKVKVIRIALMKAFLGLRNRTIIDIDCFTILLAKGLATPVILMIEGIWDGKI